MVCPFRNTCVYFCALHDLRHFEQRMFGGLDQTGLMKFRGIIAHNIKYDVPSQPVCHIVRVHNFRRLEAKLKETQDMLHQKRQLLESVQDDGDVANKTAAGVIRRPKMGAFQNCQSAVCLDICQAAENELLPSEVAACSSNQTPRTLACLQPRWLPVRRPQISQLPQPRRVPRQPR